VAGAVAASRGALQVWTRGWHLVLTPQDDGGTDVEATPIEPRTGMRVEIAFGPALPADAGALIWAKQAILLSRGEPGYGGKPSPYWYDADHWFELVRSAGPRPVRDLIAHLDGCTGAKAGKIAAAFRNRTCNTLSREETTGLLLAARAEAKPVRPERLGRIGPIDHEAFPRHHALETGSFQRGVAPAAEVPFVVEAWADARPGADDGASLTATVNRTPVTGQIQLYRGAKTWWIYGCNLDHLIDVKKGCYEVWLNITSPFVPITTDGKEPDLEPFAAAIVAAITKAIRRSRRELAEDRKIGGTRLSQKQVILDNLPSAAAMASGDGAYRFSQRQLFYAIRPIVINALGKAPTWDNFQKIITDHEAEHGEVPGMYRDPRGTLYTPHIEDEKALGTIAVEQYVRPAWTFNKVLYIEKEGFFETLKAARWPERHDCALLTSKGFASRAIRDFLDGLADHDEPVTVFCVHDADAYGSQIYQALQEETKARPKRRVRIINLGLDPWEALEMGLPVEPKDGESTAPVARYISEREDGPYWEAWLQTSRVELNAMSSPQFIAWLDAKMAQYNGEKVIPPGEVAGAEFADRVEERVRTDLTSRVLRDARIEEKVAERLAALDIPPREDLVVSIANSLTERSDTLWRDHLDSIVSTVCCSEEPQ
jgi:hypothetical protein